MECWGRQEEPPPQRADCSGPCADRPQDWLSQMRRAPKVPLQSHTLTS